MPNSTQTQDDARRVKLVQALERAQDEVRASRQYIAGLEKQVVSKNAVIREQGARQTLADAGIASLQKETSELLAVIAAQKNTLRIQTAEVEFLKKELAKTNRKLETSRKINQFLLVGIGAAILTAIFR